MKSRMSNGRVEDVRKPCSPVPSPKQTLKAFIHSPLPIAKFTNK